MIVSHNVVSLYTSPDSDASLASQLVMGTRVSVHETNGDFSLVSGDDHYKGWMHREFLSEPTDHSDYPRTTIASMVADIHESPATSSPIITKLTVATPVVLGRHDSGRDFTPVLLPFNRTGFTHRVNLSSSYRSGDMTDGENKLYEAVTSLDKKQLYEMLMPKLMELVITSALRFIGTPYLWGGCTPFGIDCSGFTQLVYKIAGIQLLRDASIQINDRRFYAVGGEKLCDVDLKQGDLLFFHSRKASIARPIGHVGVALGDGRFIHALGGGNGVVVSDCADEQWQSIYAGARRISAHPDLSINRA